MTSPPRMQRRRRPTLQHHACGARLGARVHAVPPAMRAIWHHVIDATIWIVTAGSDVPVCIIETTEVRVIPFDEVTADYAWDGGEEDRGLASWREIYWEYIERECQRIGLGPNTKAPLVMERFRVVYSEPLRLGRER